MAVPTKPTPPSPRATRTSPDTFPALADDTVTYLFTDAPDYAEAVADFVELKADETLAAAVAGNLSGLDLVALAGDLIGVNVAGTALEGVTITPSVQSTETVAGIAELATQAEAEAGVDDLAMMTALKTAQAIVALGIGVETFQSKAVISSDAVVDFTLVSGVDAHVFSYNGVIPATDATYFNFSASDDSKATFENVAHYVHDSTADILSSSAARISRNTIGSAAGEYGVSGELVITQISGDYALVRWSATYMDAAGATRGNHGNGSIETIIALTDIRFLFSAGDAESGEIAYTTRTFV